MKKIIFTLALLLLAGCAEPVAMTKQQIIAEVKKCEQAGLKGRLLWRVTHKLTPREVVCEPK